MKNRRSDFSLGTAVSLRKASQIFFHILILNTIYLLAFSTVKNEFSGDRAVAVLGLGAFLTALGLEVLRFSNRDVDRNFRGVCTQIDITIQRSVV